MGRRDDINASVGAGPFRLYFGFSAADVLIGLLIGALFWVVVLLFSPEPERPAPPAPTPTTSYLP